MNQLQQLENHRHPGPADQREVRWASEARTTCGKQSTAPNITYYSILVGGWPTPLKNMKVNWDDYFQYMEKKKNVPNHQLGISCYLDRYDILRIWLELFLHCGFQSWYESVRVENRLVETAGQSSFARAFAYSVAWICWGHSISMGVEIRWSLIFWWWCKFHLRWILHIISS